jgi:hypothetical protein
LLERWSALDEASRTAIARQLLARVDASGSRESLVDMTSEQLRARLQELLDHGARP